MNKDQFRARFEGEGEGDLMAMLARAGRERRAAKALVDEVWRDLPEDEEALEMERMDLAAEDQPIASFPARYAVGPWRLAIGLDHQGLPFAVLESGPAVRWLLDGQELTLQPGVALSLPALTAPPTRAVWIDADGRRWEVGRG